MGGSAPTAPSAPATNGGIDPAVQAHIDAAIAPFKQREEAAATTQRDVASTAVTEFAADLANEFYTDVRGDMADLMDLAHARGRKMSMPEAYRAACAMSPDITAVIQSRQSQNLIADKRKAASSVHGTMGGTPEFDASKTTVAQDLAHAWESQGQL